METLLLAVTGVSLTVALFLGWTAWRMSRAERERTMARVAALAAASAEPVSPAADIRAGEPATTMRTTWPAPARPRTSTRAAVLQEPEEITGAPPRPEELPLRHEPVSVPSMGDGFLGTPARQSNGGQGLLAVAAFVLLMALGAAGAWMYATPPHATRVTAAAPSGAPLELISLRHVRDGDRLSVTGMVRNPGAGQAVDRVSATVLLFDEQGGYLTSTRGQIDIPHLNPGEESPFTLSVQAPADAARYRVSFRTDERIVPHVDRRADAPAAATSSVPAHAAAR